MFGLTMWWEVNQFKEQNNLQLANIQRKKKIVIIYLETWRYLLSQ